MLDTYLSEIQGNYMRMEFADVKFESVLKDARFNAKYNCKGEKSCFNKQMVTLLQNDYRKLNGEIRKYCNENHKYSKQYCRHIRNWPKRLEQEILKYKRKI